MAADLLPYPLHRQHRPLLLSAVSVATHIPLTDPFMYRLRASFNTGVLPLGVRITACRLFTPQRLPRSARMAVVWDHRRHRRHGR